VSAKLLTTTPQALFDWKRDSSFRQFVNYAYKNSKFYREKFDIYKIDPRKVRKPSDLKDFYTTAEDVVNHAEDMLCSRPHMVFESSGTTGRNKRIYMSQEDLDHSGALDRVGFYLWGIRPGDRVVNAFDFSIWIPGHLTQRGLEKSRLFTLAAGKSDPMEVYKRIPVYNINVVFGEPTWLIKLTEIAEEKGAYPLKLLIGGAENMPEAARPWMEKVWKGAKVRMVYASVECGGVLGFESEPRCDGYHVDEGDYYIEIADPDKDGYGEVVFTTLGRSVMPLIRYRTKDSSRIIDKPCPCGMRYRRLAKLRGRTDEMVVSAGGNLYPLMFEKIFKTVEGLMSDWQIVFKLRGLKEVMELNLELKDGASKDNVKENILTNIKELYPDIWKNYSISIFEMEFIYHPAGSLRAGARKLIRLADKRYTD
ncbi:MAG: hypothetical protein PHN63_05775, partial [Candidatus Omnitrophica bacterium]|nr:hypothetical protein [Candidatus Omnitrophota bacterium]